MGAMPNENTPIIGMKPKMGAPKYAPCVALEGETEMETARLPLVVDVELAKELLVVLFWLDAVTVSVTVDVDVELVVVVEWDLCLDVVVDDDEEDVVDEEEVEEELLVLTVVVTVVELTLAIVEVDVLVEVVLIEVDELIGTELVELVEVSVVDWVVGDVVDFVELWELLVDSEAKVEDVVFMLEFELSELDDESKDTFPEDGSGPVGNWGWVSCSLFANPLA